KVGGRNDVDGCAWRDIVDIDNGKAQPRPDQRTRQPQFDEISPRHQAKHGLDARVWGLFTVCGDQVHLRLAGATRVDPEVQELVVRGHYGDFHVIGGVCRVAIGVAQGGVSLRV